MGVVDWLRRAAPQAHYEAAKATRRTANWLARPTGPNAAVPPHA